jgi:CHAT domain-containing protein
LSPPLEYLDFDLLLQRDGTRYRARVLRAPGGEAQGIFDIPFNDLELENFLLKIGQPRRGIRRADTPQTQLTRQFGSQLFRALFDNDILVAYRSSLEEAERQHRGLRLRLRLNETPELAQIPWEYLHNAGLNQFLTLGRETPVVRYLELQSLIPSLLVRPPLRILVVVSNPHGVAELNTRDELDRLDEALAPLQKMGKVVLEPLGTATLEALQRRLQGRDIHVLHFIGHGGFDAASQDGLLLFEDDRGNRRAVTGGDLGVLLRNHPSLRLAVVNACDGARSSHDDPFAGVAQSLVQQRLPAVIAMQFEISDDAARVFASGFYTALANGYPVDAALVEARTAIYIKQLGAEWGTPVLFMRSPDGRLFDIQPQESAQEEGMQPQGLSKEVREPKDKGNAKQRTLFPADLLALVTSGGSVLAGLVFVLYKNQLDLALALTTLRRASSSYLGSVSLLIGVAGAVAYFAWRKKLWGKKWLLGKTAGYCFLLVMFVGCFGYFIAQTKQSREDAFLVIINLTDEKSGEPVSASKVTVLADDKVLASGISGPDGEFRTVLPPGAFPLRPRAEVIHAGYERVSLGSFFDSGTPISISMIPSRLVGPPPIVPAAFKSTFEFGGLPINLSASRDFTHFSYGFSSVESDRNLRGTGVRIKEVQVELKIRVHSQRACCDVWVLLGPSPFPFKAGGVSVADNPFLINPSPSIAPTQAHFVIGNGGKTISPETEVQFYATYDFDSKQWGGDFDSRKDCFTAPLDLPTGLHAQVFLWNGNPDVNVDIMSLSLTVEGTKPNQQ